MLSKQVVSLLTRPSSSMLHSRLENLFCIESNRTYSSIPKKKIIYLLTTWILLKNIYGKKIIIFSILLRPKYFVDKNRTIYNF